MAENMKKVMVKAPDFTRSSAVGLEVTPEKFRLAYRQAQGGEPAKLYGILKYFRKFDDEIPAAMGTLIAGVLAEEYSITPADDSAEAQRQAAIFNDVFEELDLLNLFEFLLDSRYFGMQAAELRWDSFTSNSSTVQVPTTYEVLPAGWLYAKKESKADEYNTLYIGDAPYYTYPKGSLLLMTSQKLPSYTNIDFTDFGVGLGCIRFATFKYFNLEDWAAFNEVFATPMIVGTLMEGWQESDKELLTEAVQNAGNASKMVTTDKGSISFPNADKTGSAAVFEQLFELMNRVIAVKIKSESQTDQMNKHGSNAAMVTAYGVQLNLARKMSRMLKRLVMRNIMQPVADRSFNGKLLVNFNMHVKAVQDLVKESQIDQNLKRMGWKFNKAELAEKYGRRFEENEDDQLKAPANIFGGG